MARGLELTAPSRKRPELRPSLLEELQPLQSQDIAERLRAPQLLRRLAPVKAQPTGGDLLRAIEKLPQLLDGAFQREGFLDQHGLAHVKAGQRRQRLVELPLRRIDVDTNKVEIVRDFRGIESGIQHAGTVEAPVHKA